MVTLPSFVFSLEIPESKLFTKVTHGLPGVVDEVSEFAKIFKNSKKVFSQLQYVVFDAQILDWYSELQMDADVVHGYLSYTHSYRTCTNPWFGGQ